tara:strand:+ start:1965 stop:2246 length:282 start_codon:yes stop_codon:yes gene_type:complete
MEFKTKSGKKVAFKDISIDEQDMLLDSIEYKYDEDGTVGTFKMMNTTITKWLRTGLKGDTSDKFLKTLSIEDRTEIFLELQKYIMVGEEKASK